MSIKFEKEVIMNKRPQILVCVTKQYSYRKLIEEGEKLSHKLKGNLTVLHVTTKELDDCGSDISELFNIIKRHNASMSLVSSKNIYLTIKKFILENHMDYVIVGESNKEYSPLKISQLLEQDIGSKVKIIVINTQDAFNMKDII